MTQRKMSLKLLFTVTTAVASFLGVTPSLAQTTGTTGYRNIVYMGCHKTDSTCFVAISGTTVGPAGCNWSEFRWDSSTIPGKNHMALLMSAHARGKRVNFYISPTCYANQPNYATFEYAIYE
jgi:hypothetical protein